MFVSLLKTDKAPFILAVTLSLLGWFLTTTISNLSEVIVLGVEQTPIKDGVRFTVSNHSIKRSLSSAALSFKCKKAPCLETVGAGDSRNFATDKSVPPYAILGNKLCTGTAQSIDAVVTLPPSAQIQYEFITKTPNDLVFTYLGKALESACPHSEATLTDENIWILIGHSPTLLLIQCYNALLVIAFAATLGFLLFLLFVPRPPERASYDT